MKLIVAVLVMTPEVRYCVCKCLTLSPIPNQPAVCIIFCTLRLNIILPLRLGIPGDLFPPDFPNHIGECIFLVSYVVIITTTKIITVKCNTYHAGILLFVKSVFLGTV